MARKILSDIYLFKQLDEQELDRLESIAETRHFNSDDIIFDQGDEADSLYVIQYGSVQIRRNDDDTLGIRTLGSGSHFGEMSLIDEQKRSAGATVKEPSELVIIRYAPLLELLDAHPAIAVKFYRAIARYLSGRLRRTTTDLGFARERTMHHV